MTDEPVPENDIRKEELEKSVSRAAKLADEILQARTQNTIEVSKTRDTAYAFIPLIADLLPISNYESLIHSWVQFGDNLQTTLDQESKITSVLSSGSGGTATLLTSTDISMVRYGCPPPIKKDIELKIDRYQATVSQQSDFSETIDRLRSLRIFEAYHGEMSAAEHLQIAFTAYHSIGSDDNPVETYFLPLRSCLVTVIDSLIHNCHSDEKTKNIPSKLSLIGKTFRKEAVDQNRFNDLANQLANINDILSSGKRKIFSRDEAFFWMTQVVLFINTLLDSLDLSELSK